MRWISKDRIRDIYPIDYTGSYMDIWCSIAGRYDIVAVSRVRDTDLKDFISLKDVDLNWFMMNSSLYDHTLLAKDAFGNRYLMLFPYLSTNECWEALEGYHISKSYCDVCGKSDSFYGNGTNLVVIHDDCL